MNLIGRKKTKHWNKERGWYIHVQYTACSGYLNRNYSPAIQYAPQTFLNIYFIKTRLFKEHFSPPGTSTKSYFFFSVSVLSSLSLLCQLSAASCTTHNIELMCNVSILVQRSVPCCGLDLNCVVRCFLMVKQST